MTDDQRDTFATQLTQMLVPLPRGRRRLGEGVSHLQSDTQTGK